MRHVFPDEEPRILVCGWSGADNIGDELLIGEVVKTLIANGAKPILVARNPTKSAAWHQCETLRWGPRGWLRLLFSKSKYGTHVDGVCVGPGGIIQDMSSIWSLPGHLLGPLLLKMMGKPVAGVGLGVDPLRRLSSRLLVRAVLKNSDVVVRDASSWQTLNPIRVPAEVGDDLVFGLKLSGAEKSNKIVVAVGPITAPGHLRAAQNHLLFDDPAKLAAQLDTLAKRTNSTLCFAPFRGQRDLSFARKLAQHLYQELEIIPPDAAVTSIASARLLITNRYHPLVIAALAGTAAIVCSPEVKVKSLIPRLDNSQTIEIANWSHLADCEHPERLSLKSPASVQRHHDALKKLINLSRSS